MDLSCFANRKTVFWMILTVFLLVIDRFLKILVQRLTVEYKILGKYFIFILAKNKYIAFSLPVSGIFLNFIIVFTIVVLLYFFIYNCQKKNKFIFIPLIFIILGATSNLYDRLKYGYVVDYLYLPYFTVFNIADVMIVVAALFLISINFFQKKY